jgi:hypothetical protein
MRDAPEHVTVGTRLEMFVVYEHPLDFPESFVVRRWVVELGATRPDPLPVALGLTLEEVRKKLLAEQPDLVRTAPMAMDDPCIKEVWL